jgi:hypothetical protein
MEGAGRYTYGNGDVYVGAFKAGKCCPAQHCAASTSMAGFLAKAATGTVGALGIWCSHSQLSFKTTTQHLAQTMMQADSLLFRYSSCATMLNTAASHHQYGSCAHVHTCTR